MINSCYATVYSTLLRVRHRANITYPFDPITQLTNYFPEIKLIKYSSLDPVDLATAKKTHPYGFSIIGITTGSMQIYYNDLNQCLKRQRFTIAHELGHLMLGHVGMLKTSRFEELLEAEPDSVVYVPIIFQGRKKHLHAFKVNGTSMNNVIPDGSIVVIEDTHSNAMQYSDGTIIVAFMDGKATVKRLYSSGKQVMLMPDSSDKTHTPIPITQEQQLIIIGKVIWHMNPEDIAEKCY